MHSTWTQGQRQVHGASFPISRCQGIIASFRIPRHLHLHDTPKAIPPLVTTGNYPEQTRESKRNSQRIPKCQGREGQSPKLTASLWPLREPKFPLQCLWPGRMNSSSGSLRLSKTLTFPALKRTPSQEYRKALSW